MDLALSNHHLFTCNNSSDMYNRPTNSKYFTVPLNLLVNTWQLVENSIRMIKPQSCKDFA